MAERQSRDAELRRAVLAGDRHAWRTLYNSAFESLFAYVQWRCGGLRDATEDIVQETWLVAVRKIAQFDPHKADFRTWIRGIAANLIRNYFRATRRRPATSGMVSELPASAGRPADLDDTADRIAQALTELPEHYEAVLRAKYLDRRSMEDIAAEQRTTVKAVESLLSRARAAFERSYGPRSEAEVRIQR
jgi:RNA polymerase sigma-70 factor (ECF subfamily)